MAFQGAQADEAPVLVIITSNPCNIQFSSATYLVNEAGVTATITATRTNSPYGAVSVDYSTVAGGTAVDGTHYVSTSGTLNWADGDMADKTFTIDITDNGTSDGFKTVNLELTNATGFSTLGTQTTATLMIIDDESSGIIYVDQANSGTEDGSSWATAWNTLQEGLDFAALGGGNEIWVAAGTYSTTSQTSYFNMLTGVNIYGGFNGTETLLSERNWTANVTILSGDRDSSNSATAGDSYHVVYFNNDDNVRLDGFTIRYGYANGATAPDGYGGGICIQNGSTGVTIANCIVEYCSSTYSGGGIYFDVTSGALTIQDCTVQYCTKTETATGSGGGGIFVNAGSFTITGTTIQDCASS